MGFSEVWDIIPTTISKNDAILGAIQRLMQRSSAKIPSARKAYLVLSALLLLSVSQVAHANQCFINGPRYRMDLDTVEWRMWNFAGAKIVYMAFALATCGTLRLA